MKKSRTVICVAVAVFALLGVTLKELFFSQSVNYYVTSVAILVLSLLPFFVSFEHKKISARDVTLTATLIALAVVGRAAFYLIPQVIRGQCACTAVRFRAQLWKHAARRLCTELWWKLLSCRLDVLIA